jgi:hypothetical protein
MILLKISRFKKNFCRDFRQAKYHLKIVTKLNIFRMETHRPVHFWGDLRGFALLLPWILLLSTSKPGNGVIFSSELILGTLFTHRAQWENPSESDPFLFGIYLNICSLKM